MLRPQPLSAALLIALSGQAAGQSTDPFPAQFNLSTLNGDNGFVIWGIDASDFSGRSVSSAGDVNGDGIDDLIIGAIGASLGGNPNAGASYVVFGSTTVVSSGVVDLFALDGSNGFVLRGIDAGDSAGLSVSSAGDVNGDGIDDLIIGASFADANGNYSGESYVVFGESGLGSSRVIELSALNGGNGFVIKGIDAYDLSGSSVSSAGDVNGDGIDDLIIGASGADSNGNSDAGESYVIFGATDVGSAGAIELFTLDGTNGFKLNGIDASDRSGYSVSSAGDVNGDGIDDLIIGASYADANGNYSGESYVIFGAPDIGNYSAVNLSALNGTDGFVLNGIDPGDRSGTSVSSAGDVNGDGFDDILIGAPLADPNGDAQAGESYVVFGAPNVGATGSIDLAALNGSNGFVLNGIDEYDFTGISASSAGDVNGDGFDDIIIGARFAAPNGNAYAGETYIVFGGAAVGAAGSIELSAFNGTNGFTLNGIDTDDYAGTSVSAAGDVNGDGIDDLIIGATGADPFGYSNAGESYVVFGRALQVWNRPSGGAFEGDANWNSGRSPVAGPVFIEPEFGGTVTLADPARFLGSLTIASNRGVTRLDIDQGSLLSVGAPLSLPFSAAVSGSGILVADAGLDNAGEIAGPSLTVVSQTGVRNTGLVNIDGRSTSGIASVSVFGPLDNLSGGEVRLRGESNISADAIANGGEMSVAFADASVDGPFNNSGAETAITGFILNGIDANDQSGYSVSSAGDINGDGIDDLIIGARRADPNASSSGETYVVFGTPGVGESGIVELSSLNGSNGFVLHGEDFYDVSGSAVSSAGDLNGDGIDDLVIGAPLANPSSGTDAGKSYVVFGAIDVGASGVIELSALNGSNGFVLNGIATNDLSGISVSSAGDVNGDAIDDLIIGAAEANANGITLVGQSYVVFGAPAIGATGTIELSALNGSNGFVLDGIDAADFSGFSVSSAGDVNADGTDDFIIGAFVGDPNGNNSGESYVVFGAPALGASGIIELSSLNGTNGFVLNGIDASDRSGFSVSSAGDVNGDGIDDLIIGAPYADASGNYSGESYVVFGASGLGSPGVIELSALNGTNGFVLNGVDAGDRSGHSVSNAGDVNGDGISDLIIGARVADPNGNTSAGATYVVFGAVGLGSAGAVELSSLNGSNGFVLNGINVQDRSGHSVSSAGDVNNDGFGDLIIGAYQADSNAQFDTGQSYVLFGSPGLGASGVIELSDLNLPVEQPVSGLVTVAGNSELLFTNELANPGTIILNSDSDIVILGSLSGNGVEGPAGPGSAGSVFAFDGVLPGTSSAGNGARVGTSSTGVMRFDGDLQLSASSQLVIDIAGTTPGSGHDQLVVAGTLTGSGALQIQLAPTFTPAPNTQFQLLDFGTFVGSFNSIQLPQALIDLNADTSQIAIDGTLIIPGNPCPTDLVPNGQTDIEDLLLVLRAFGSNADGDTDGDNDTDIEDLLAVLRQFGKGC